MSEENLWYIKRVSAEEYKALVPDRRVFFNEPDFTELNKDKADGIYYLLFMRENSARFGLISGKVGSEMRTPYSAPYSYPVAIINESKQETIDAVLAVYEKYCIEQGAESIRFIFPPLFYDEHLLSGWVSAFYRGGYRVLNLDVNYALNLEKLNVDKESYGQMITQKGRKGLRRAERSGLEIVKCESEEDYKTAYEIIRIGHASKGFPVKMSYKQLMSTLKLVEHDAFMVKKMACALLLSFYIRLTTELYRVFILALILIT